ncbi:MAG TPA: hypothetical protein VEG34_07910, partial [Thermoanaerobaculia bacterium]|nr:hypothetical protein [Thermoanaerobaculia bacterium]
MHTMRDHFHLAQIDQPCRPARARALCRLAAALAILLAAGPAAAQQWRSPLWGRDYVVIERQSAETLGRARVTALLGPEAVEYEAFTAAYLPREQSAAVLGEIERAGLSYQHETDRWERLAARQGAGLEAWSGLGVTPRPVPGLYLARFAFPVRPEWLRSAAECGAEVKAVLDSATVVLQSAAPGSLPSCRGFRHLAWLDPFSTTDRAEPGLLAETDDSVPASWSLQFFQGTSLEEVLKALPAAVEVLGWDRSPQTGILLVQVLADRADVLRVLEESEHLLALAPDGEASPSDERQGQILAGNHNGTAVAATGYLAWLSGRGLSSAANQQTVAVFDTGYDDGTAAGPHHPDLENPRRYLDGAFYTGPSLLDTGGHGTMVAGIVAG